jgi:hypothetical protein
MDMKDDNDTHSLDTWTSLDKAASNLLTRLRVQPRSRSRDVDDTLASQPAHALTNSVSQPKRETPNGDKILEKPTSAPF